MHRALLALAFCLIPLSAAEPAFRVVSLNLHSEPDPAPLIEELRQDRLADPDFFLLQEVIGETPTSSLVANRIAAARKMHVFYQGAFPLPSGKMYGLAILSRYPLRDQEVVLLKHMNLNVRSRKRIALLAMADTPQGPVRVINTHLDTRIELAPRLEQLEPALTRAAAESHPVILGGDFNTNPCKWVWNMFPLPYAEDQAAGLEAFMKQKGFLSPVPASLPTHDLFKMRLDWVFLKGFSSDSYQVKPMRYSDHHAVSVEFRSARITTSLGR